MQSSRGKFSEPYQHMEKRSVWGWLAAAAAAGVLVARGHHKAGLMLGLSALLWRDVLSNGIAAVPSASVAPPSDGIGAPEAAPATAASTPTGSLLNLEPLPLVVSDDTPTGALGAEGSGLLNQAPGAEVEEEWLSPALGYEPWLSATAEIPDAVELPDLDTTPDPLPGTPKSA